MDRFDWLEIDPGATGTAADEAVQRLRPHDGPTFYRAARHMRDAGHFRAAVDFYRQSVGFDEHHYPAWVELIDTLIRARRIEDAAQQAAHALKHYRQVRPLYASQALVLAHQKQFREADQHSLISLEGGEQSWYARCVRAELLLRQDASFRGEALHLIDEAYGMASAPWEVYFAGGWMLLDAELPTLAAGYFAEAAHANPRAPVTWLCLGDCFQVLRLYEQAMFYYHRVLELEPNHELARKRQKQCGGKLYGLMRVFGRQTMQDRWQQEYDKLNRQDP